MIYDKDGDINYEAWYQMNKEFIPSPLIENMEDSHDLMYFLYHVYRKVMKELEPALLKLIYLQYPVFKKEKRPLVVEWIQGIASTTGHSLLFILYHLIQEQKEGVNVREKYPEFDQWKNFYACPHEPHTIDESTRSLHTWLTDEEWVKYVENENKSLLEFFNWKEKRKKEFIDVVQNILFKYYKEMEELNADEWVLYAVGIVDEYDYYLTSCDHMEDFIDGGFPEEDINLSDAEFFDKYRKLPKETHDHMRNLRNRRISGECI